VKVSVVIPTLNEERFIAECIRSIRAQGVPCEIIVVDGGSTDRTVEIARQHADRVYVLNEKGIWLARDYGTRMASGDIIVSTDADTYHPEGWLEALLEPFSDLDVAVTGGPVQPMKPSSLANFYSGFAVVPALNFFNGANTAFRKSAFLKVGGYLPLERGEDWNLSFRLSRVGKAVFVPEAVVLIDVPENRRAETLSFPVAFGMALTGDPLLSGMSAGFWTSELVTAVVEEPSPVHHSHVGLAGLAASTAVKGLVPEVARKTVGGVFSGITWHHVVTEDVLDPGSFASVTPLWLGLTFLLAAT